MEGVQAVNCQLFIVGPHYSACAGGAGGGGQQCGGRNLFAANKGWWRWRSVFLMVTFFFSFYDRFCGAALIPKTVIKTAVNFVSPIDGPVQVNQPPHPTPFFFFATLEAKE